MLTKHFKVFYVNNKGNITVECNLLENVFNI